MTNRQYIIFVIISIVLLVFVFFMWIVSDMGSYSSVLFDNGQPQAADKPVVSDKGRVDPLITAARDLYISYIKESDPLRGEANAELVILEFGDYECPYCRQLFPELTKILAEYQGRVSLVWKDFPNPSHLEARKAALAARCAGEQGKFWNYHDYLFTNQDNLSRDMYNKIALEVGLNLAKFNKCLDTQEKIKEVGQGLVDGQKLGVDATPYLFIGNKRFNYAMSYEELKKAVEEELNRQ